MFDMYKLREEKEQEEVISLFHDQIKVEEELLRHYRQIATDSDNRPLQILLRLLQSDSLKNIEFCKLAIAIILEEEELFSSEKQQLQQALQPHRELVDGFTSQINSILMDDVVKQNQGLCELLKKMREDDIRYPKDMKNLLKEMFFRLDPNDMVTKMRSSEFLEGREKRKRDHRRRNAEKGL